MCVCVASVRVQTLVASICRCACAEAHRTLSVGFRATRQRRYKIVLLPQCGGVCAARQLVLISATWRQKQVLRRIELVLFLTPDAWY